MLLDSEICSQYLFKTICALQENRQIELHILKNKCCESVGIYRKVTNLLKAKGFVRAIDVCVFKAVQVAEIVLLSIISKKIKQSIFEHTKTLSVLKCAKKSIIDLSPIKSASGLVVRYPQEDVTAIRKLELDVIIRGNASGIFQGEILNVAKLGIISFHHGDNRWNRGGPPAFWEVVFEKPSTGFIIQILNSELDGGVVVFRGNLPTARTFTENQIQLYKDSNPWLERVVLEYAKTGKVLFKEESMPYGGSLLSVPTCCISARYFIKTCARFLRGFIDRCILRRHNRWGVAFCPTTWEKSVLRKGIRIKNQPGRFFADPFVITKNERTICLVEDYCYKSKIGCISAIEIFADNSYEYLGPVVQEDFHMSFPYIFEYCGHIYMVPESIDSNSIRLYKCVEYPMKWRYEKDILSSCSAADSMIFEHNSKWWLLTNMTPEKDMNHSSQLYAFHTDNPLSGEWIPHAQNPLIFDSAVARNAGILNIGTGFPVRVRQKQGFNLYGKSLTLARIMELTPSKFREEEIAAVAPEFFSKIRCAHHLHSNGRYTVFDFLRTDSIK